MKIGIIGGGWTGLVAAYQLSGSSHSIKIFEKEAQLGGLATYHNYQYFIWDRFYHVILPSDVYLLDFIKALGLENQLHWKKTYTGVYVDQQFYSVSNNREFLLFPPLHLLQKFRLAFTIFYASRILDWQKLEAISVEKWLIKLGGKKTYEKFWKPLLLAKLGKAYQRVSAVFIWTYIKRLFEARNAAAHQEQMGYLRGGYKTILDRLETVLPQRGVEVHTASQVTHLRAAAGGGIIVVNNGVEEHFDKVIVTAPVNVLEKIVPPALIHLQKSATPVEYLGVVCLVVLTRKPFTPFYVLNIADEQIAFTGVIGMSTLVDPQETSGYYLTYLPKYVLSDDPLLLQNDETIKAQFLPDLYKMYPDLKADDLVEVFINRAFKVQPLQVQHYSKIIPDIHTKHPDFFVLNTAQFVNDTLNNNAVVHHVTQFLAKHGAAILQKQAQPALRTKTVAP